MKIAKKRPTMEMFDTIVSRWKEQLMLGETDTNELVLRLRDFVEREVNEIKYRRWIPCSERLPEVDTNVLIYYPKWEDAPVQTAHIMLDETCWEFSDGEFYPSKREITHWMQLPEPPEKE